MLQLDFGFSKLIYCPSSQQESVLHTGPVILKYNIHDRFVEAQPNSLQFEGGKNDILIPSCEVAREEISYFCHPKAEVNEVRPRQNGHKRYSYYFASLFLIKKLKKSEFLPL